MWLIKITILLVSIQSIRTAKNEYLALEEIHYELTQIEKRANNYRLETDVHSDTVSPVQIHDWILNRNTKFMDLQNAYENLDISEGFPGQTELLDLYDEEMESGYSHETGEKVLEGFKEFDGLEYLRKKIVALDVDDIKMKVQMSEKKLPNIKSFDPTNSYSLKEWTKKLEEIYDLIEMIPLEIEMFTRMYPKISKLSDKEKKVCDDDFRRLKSLYHTVIDGFNDFRKILEDAGYLGFEDILHPFIPVREVTVDVIKKMDQFKKWEELSSTLGEVVEEINRLNKLKPMIPNVNKVFEDVKKDFGQFENYEISEKVYKTYQDIESLQSLLQKIRSLTSYMNKKEPRVKKMMVNSKTVEEHFRKLDISDEISTEMFEGFQKCLKMFDSSIEISMKEIDKFYANLGAVHVPIEQLYADLETLTKIQNHPQFSMLAEDGKPEILDDGIHEILESTIIPSKELIKWLEDNKHYGDMARIFRDSAKLIQQDMKEKTLDFKEMERFAETTVHQLNNVKEVLVCYGDLDVASSSVETLLDSMKDKWKFNPMDLESTVEVLGTFKDAYKKVKEVWDWKRDGYNPNDNTPYNRFVLSEEDVNKITVVLNGFESIRNVEKMWDSLKDLDIQNVHWDKLNESVSSFLEHVSKLDSKISLIDFFGLEPFQLNGYKDDIKNQVKKFIDEEYEGSRKTGILNLLEEIEQVIDKYPTVDMIKNMNEAAEEMKNWEKNNRNGKEEMGQTFIDCSMNSCDVIPKLPPVGPDAPVKNVEL